MTVSIGEDTNTTEDIRIPRQTRLAVLLALSATLAGCAPEAEPAPASTRTTATGRRSIVGMCEEKLDGPPYSCPRLRTASGDA